MGQGHAKSQGVQSFDWYSDSRRGIYKRGRGAKSMMIAVDLETGEEQLLFTGPFVEMDVAPDGSAVAFCFGRGHMSTGLPTERSDGTWLMCPGSPGGHIMVGDIPYGQDEELWKTCGR
jgi:hypothetical protein